MIAQGWLYGAAFAAGLLVAGVAQEWRSDAAMATYQASVAKDAKERALAVLLALESAGAKVQAGEAAISKQREDNAKLQAVANAETERLTRCIANGTCGLRVAAKCSAPGPVQATSSNSAVRDSEGTARLTAAAGQDYLEFRRRYTDQLNTLKLCKTFAETQKPSQ